MKKVGCVPTKEAIFNREFYDVKSVSREIATSAIGAIKKRKRIKTMSKDPMDYAHWKREMRARVNPAREDRVLLYFSDGNQAYYKEVFLLKVASLNEVYKFMRDYSLNGYYLEMPLSDIPSGRWFDGHPNIKKIADNRFVLRYQWLLDC